MGRQGSLRCATAAVLRLLALYLLAPQPASAQPFACDPSNDPVMCAALGDFYYAVGGASWTFSTSASWQSAAQGQPTHYCLLQGLNIPGTCFYGVPEFL
jgi:hypothetical protein